MEVAVGVVEDDGLSVLRRQLVVPRRRQSLAERCAVLEREARFAQRVAEASPRLAAGTLVALVHEDQVVALEGLHGHAHAAAALFLHQFGNLDDPDRVFPIHHQTALVQIEPPGRNIRGGHLHHVLIAQSLVRRDQQDVVQRQVVIVQELAVVDMHDQRLTAAGRHPECQLLQVGFREPGVLRLTGGLRGVALLDEAVQRAEHPSPPVEVPVQEYLRVEDCDVLEVPKRDRLGPPDIHGTQVLADVVVVAGQVGRRNFHLVPA